MKAKNLIFIPLLFLSVSSCVSVPSEIDPPIVNVKVTGISLDSDHLSIEEGSSTILNATVHPDNATNKSISYSSNNSNIASVDSKGLITAKKEGSCVITATTVDGGYTAKCNVTVTKASGTTIHVTGVSLNKSSLSLYEGGSETLLASILPSNATNKQVTWSSSNTNFVSVSSTGLVSALKEGNAAITVTTIDGGYTATCNVTVSKSSSSVAVTGVSLDKSSLTINANEKYTFTVTVAPSNATNKNVSWSSNDSTVAEISQSGVLSALKAGSTTITVKTIDGGYTATCNVTVKEDETFISDGRMQDTAILHCWNWSMNNIISRLSEIKEAGFKTIQISPMQPQKDYYAYGNWSGQWWKLYQPLGFSIAQSGQNVLGTKADLATLCKKAEEYDIDVIVDVVTNHLAGGSKTTINGAVQNYEPDIYNNKLIHTLDKWAKDDDSESIVRGNIGDYPDLMTESTTVQNRVISMLKEYIDCGVDGFRFDAAKHIETPSDGDYASEYWPNVIGASNDYAESKGLEAPYVYGEILTTCGKYRSYDYYKDYMSTIDNNQGSDTLKSVVEKSISKLSARYKAKMEANQLVLWAESHDTYANDDHETTDISIEDIHKTYIIQGSRKDAATLYFARPGNANFGEVGTTYYKNNEVKAINKFHANFLNESENIYIGEEGCFVNVRGNMGVVIVGVANYLDTLTLDVPGLVDGTYLDSLSNKTYEVKDEKITVTLSGLKSLILTNVNKPSTNKPELSVGSYNELYKDTQTISVNSMYADKVTYSINNGSEIDVSNNQIILPSFLSDGLINLKIEATNKYGVVTKSIKLLKSSKLYNCSFAISDVSTTDSLLCWAWKDSSNGSWYDPIVDGSNIGFNINNCNHFIIVKFPSGTTSSNANWDNKKAQTENFELTKKLYSYNELGL